MNKGLEFIEAMRLYELPPEKIQVVVHRESVIHSLVEFGGAEPFWLSWGRRICVCPSNMP